MMQDDELFRIVRKKLFTAVIGDVMDAAGLVHQFLPPHMRALLPDAMLVGRAMPVLEGDITKPGGEPFGLMFKALDDMKPDEVYITTGASPTYALWGGLMSTRAKALGAAGAVLDGFHRDTREITALNFPIFSAGSYAQDQKVRGHVKDFRCSLTFVNGAKVETGDVIVGDIDGVLVVPKNHVADIVQAALTKVEGENAVRHMILDGQSTQAVFDKTGIM